MTTQEKIEAIRKECIRVNPSITTLPRFPEDSDAARAVVALSRIVDTSAITEDMRSFATVAIKQYEDEKRAAYTRELEQRYPSLRPIGLADVLLAIPKWSNEKMESLAILGFNYGNPNVVLIMDSKHTHPRAEWNLLKPLEDQEESTIDFIYDVLYGT